MRIEGYRRVFSLDRVQPEVETAVRAALAKAEALGAEIKPVWLPDMNAINAVAQLIIMSEASAIFEPYLEHRGRFGADVLMRLDQGRLIPATDYINAQRLRRKMRRYDCARRTTSSKSGRAGVARAR